MDYYRLIYERLMLKAFDLESRFEIRFANADFFDTAYREKNPDKVSIAMMCAFCNLLKTKTQNKEWVSSTIKQLSGSGDKWETIYKILSELPIDCQ